MSIGLQLLLVRLDESQVRLEQLLMNLHACTLLFRPLCSPFRPASDCCFTNAVSTHMFSFCRNTRPRLGPKKR